MSGHEFQKLLTGKVERGFDDGTVAAVGGWGSCQCELGLWVSVYWGDKSAQDLAYWTKLLADENSSKYWSKWTKLSPRNGLHIKSIIT